MVGTASFIARDPDAVVLFSFQEAPEDTEADFLAIPETSGLTAVQEGNAIVVPAGCYQGNQLAVTGLEILAERPLVRDDPSTWVKPKIRLWFDQADGPVRRAMNTSRLHGAYDQLAGAGRWRAAPFFSSEVRVRFPDHGTSGYYDEWHVDHAFALGDSVGLNLTSSLRAFLLLVLLTDCGPDDAPTMLRACSHVAAARVFAETADEPLRWDDVVPRIADLDDYPVVAATGDAGDVYLCHPVVVHSPQSHHGTTPRFAAQVGLQLWEPMSLDRPDGDYSPLEQAARLGVEQASRDAGSPVRLPRAQARSPVG